MNPGTGEDEELPHRFSTTFKSTQVSSSALASGFSFDRAMGVWNFKQGLNWVPKLVCSLVRFLGKICILALVWDYFSRNHFFSAMFLAPFFAFGEGTVQDYTVEGTLDLLIYLEF